jgi:hypothetical protein
MALPSYDIDFRKLVGQLLGSLLKKSKRIAWLTAALKPVRDLHDEFLAFTNLKAYEAKWNGQTIKLEKLLQDKFGSGITISNNSQNLDEFLIGDGADVGGHWGDGPDVESYIGASYNPALFNFTVNVPGSIVFVQSEMEAWINKYKLFGTTYNIIIV